MTHFYRTQGVCSGTITFDLEKNIVTNIRFTGGCHGNLQAIERLLDGASVEQIVEKCEGIQCGRKTTSCADQLSRAVRIAYEKEKNGDNYLNSFF